MKTKHFISRKSNNAAELEEIFVEPTQEETNKVEHLIDKKNIKATKIIFFVVLFLLFLQAAYLQIIKGDYYAKKSERNYTRITAVKSPRGIIYDRNQNQIVFNVPVFDLVIIPYDFFKESDKISKKISDLSEAIGINKNDFDEKIEEINPLSDQPFLILGNIDKEDALIIEEKIKNIDGAELEKSSVRNYVDGNYFSNIIGYNGRINEDELEKHPDYLLNDIIGKNGLELVYEKQLRGKYGKQEIEVDSFGRKIKIIEQEDCELGNNLVLNIDAGLQRKIYDELSEIVEKLETKNGAVAVAINPKNGAVLALVSFPSYNNNLFARGINSGDYDRLLSDEMKPLFNKAISGEYPPGSVIKPLIGAAALQENIISPSKIIVGGEAIYVGSYRYLDWKAHGPVNLVKAIAQSCNVYFYTVGGGHGGIEGLGIERIKKYANLFGFGELLGIDIPEESDGLVPDREWKKNVKSERWYIGDTYHVSIGQGDILATPLQIAVYTAAIANDGKLFQPQIVDKAIDLNGNTVEDIEPRIIRENFIDLENMKWIQKGMRENVVSGSGRALANLSVEVAGKTGTAQYARNEKTHAWYTAYAPYDDPEIALTVLIEGGGEGHAAAVPVAKEVLEWYFKEE